ncbi:unnamed protein product, partial [Iphiclides podalirius]
MQSALKRPRPRANLRHAESYRSCPLFNPASFVPTPDEQTRAASTGSLLRQRLIAILIDKSSSGKCEP